MAYLASGDQRISLTSVLWACGFVAFALSSFYVYCNFWPEVQFVGGAYDVFVL